MPEYAHDFPDVTSVGIGAFAKAHFEGAINLPKVQSLPDAAGCPERPDSADHNYGVFEESNFSNGNFSNLTYIGSRSFFNCKLPEDLTDVLTLEFPNVIEIGESAFENVRIRDNEGAQPSRVFINMPKVSIIGEKGFYESTIGLVSIKEGKKILDLQECTEIRNSAFNHFYQQYGIGVDRIYLPKLRNIGQYAFKGLSLGNTNRLEIHINKPNSGICTFHRNVFHSAPQNVYLFFYSENPPYYDPEEGRPSLNTEGDISGEHPWTENSWCPIKIYVPYGCREDYRSSTLFEPYGNAEEYGDCIEEMPQDAHYPYNPFQ